MTSLTSFGLAELALDREVFSSIPAPSKSFQANLLFSNAFRDGAFKNGTVALAMVLKNA